MVDMFDTLGTLYAACERAGLVDEAGEPLNMNEGMLSDAIATTVGAICGTSTVTTFSEVNAGVAAGGRTGLTSVFAGLFFFIAMFLSPVAQLVPSCATAAVLIYVGILMMGAVKNIDWEDFKISVPAFLTLSVMPFTYNISYGIAFGLISYIVISVFCGDFKKIKVSPWVITFLFIAILLLTHSCRRTTALCRKLERKAIMWEKLNFSILILELLIIICSVFFVARKNNSMKTFVYACTVFVLNFGLYTIPWVYEVLEHGVEGSVLLQLLSVMSSTIKQFVGEVRVESVEAYAQTFPLYRWVFFIGAILAIVATFGAAINVFGKKIRNGWRVNRILSGEKCDIIADYTEDALSYAKRNKNTVLLVQDTVEQAFVKGLISEGYAVLHKSLSTAFLDGRYLNERTAYNILCLNERDNISGDLQVILNYLDTCKQKKNIRFYVEIDDNVTDVIQKQIGEREDAAKARNDGRSYREHITVFTRNELLARDFVGKYPLSLHLPKEFFAADTSLKPDVKLNVFMLGFTALSKEIYKQYVINNQFATVRDGEYRVLPLHYHIYAASADEREWQIDGLKMTLKNLAEHPELYFPLPELPYDTRCVRERMYGIDCVREVAEQAKASDFSCFMIDTGDVYRNISISNSLKLLLDSCENYHIYVYTGALQISADEKTTCYGAIESILTHEVIVDEHLYTFAKAINMKYFRDDQEARGRTFKTHAELVQANEEDWRQATYFRRSSNVSLANSIRMKLHLLGLDYVADGKAAGWSAFPKYSNAEKTYESCLTFCQRSALLAQEHYRWNAYHLLNGWLPMKKEKATVVRKKKKKKPDERQREKKPYDIIRKETEAKKHACLTTFNGLDVLARHLAAESKKDFPNKNYPASEFEFYKNDGLLLELAPTYFKKMGYSVYKR